MTPFGFKILNILHVRLNENQFTEQPERILSNTPIKGCLDSIKEGLLWLRSLSHLSRNSFQFVK